MSKFYDSSLDVTRKDPIVNVYTELALAPVVVCSGLRTCVEYGFQNAKAGSAKLLRSRTTSSVGFHKYL